MDDLSYITFFILNRSKEYVDIDSGLKIDLDNVSSAIGKSLYTCVLQSLFDYSRIVWDLFPNGEKLLQFIACSPELTYEINHLNPLEQNCDYLLDVCVELNQKLMNDASFFNHISDQLFLLNGFKQALKNLTSLKQTCGRIIFMTFINEDILTNFKKVLLNDFENYNNETKFKITNLHIVVMNVYPLKTSLENLPKSNLEDQLNKYLKFSVICIPADSLLTKMVSFAIKNYDLISTTVCNIPMKEEQNACSSANYDVEIIHSKNAHSQFFENAQIANANEFYQNSNKDESKSLKLKWCLLPKSNQIDINYCSNIHRVTALEINSRPSLCLINYLHSGKNVILEFQPKMISHLLRCHKNELYIHVLPVNNVIEDIPAITDYVGNDVNYRFNDYAEFIKKNCLTNKSDQNTANYNYLEQADFLLKKETIYWPISSCLTVFFNMREQLHEFYQLITKEKLTESDFLELKNIIYKWVKLDVNGSNPPMQNNIIRYKNVKKEDLYKILWCEMEHLIRSYNNSAEHQKILQCYFDCNQRPINLINNQDNLKLKNIAKIDYEKIKLSEENLEDIFIKRLETKRKQKQDFYGRNAKSFKLYASLNNK